MAGKSITIRDFSTEIPGGFIDDFTWQFPAVESKTSTGKDTTWVMNVKLFASDNIIDFKEIPELAFVSARDAIDNEPLADNLFAWYKADSGHVGGKVKKCDPSIIRVGKNKGRSNATNVFCQALRDALGIYNKQVTKARPATSGNMFPPMLALDLKDQVNPLFAGDAREVNSSYVSVQKGMPAPTVEDAHVRPDAPVFVQRKYNGVRLVTTLHGAVEGVGGSVVMYTRRMKTSPNYGYIKEELAEALEMYWSEGREVYLDGEVYKHGVPLQTTSGYTRREQREGDILHDYMLYDCFVANEPDLKYSERKAIIDEIIDNFDLKYVKRVETAIATSMNDVLEEYVQYLGEDFEGAMVRIDAPYKYSYREHHSNILLKMKPVIDHEFEVVGWETGEKGRAADAIMIKCKTTSGIVFPVTPAMPISDRNALAKKMADIEANGKTHFENVWLGTMVRVYFDEWSVDKVPQRARTLMEKRDVTFD